MLMTYYLQLETETEYLHSPTFVARGSGFITAKQLKLMITTVMVMQTPKWTVCCCKTAQSSKRFQHCV